MDVVQADIAVRNGLVVSALGIRRADVYIRDGKIESLAEPGAERPAAEVIDAAGKYVMPGIIDAHLHPVYADRIDTLSAAAACEGITTLIPYIGAVKAWGKTGGLAAAIDDYIAEGETASRIDFSLHCTLMQADLEDVDQTIPRMIEKGITSFKTFMAYAKRGMKLEDHQLLRVMTIVAEHQGLFAAHAENGDIIDYLTARLTGLGQEAPEFFPPSQPNLAEAEAVFRLLTMGAVTGCTIFIPHVSAQESLAVLDFFARWGRPRFYAETCPHYLVLTEEELKKRGTLAKMAPPLRRHEDNDALWTAVAEGRIQVVGSDAAGHAINANEPLWDKVFNAPNGAPGMETLFKILYEEGVNRGRLSLPALTACLCENPARIFGLYPKKGVLRAGSDADLILLDPGRPWRIPEANPRLKVDYSLFAGKIGAGAPVLTMQRGKVIYAEGDLKAEAGQGRFVPAVRTGGAML